MTDKPKATHVTALEGSQWIPWATWQRYVSTDLLTIHSIRFEDGSEWDCVNGWRDVEKLRIAKGETNGKP
jgi:hypothetical protein